jgi:hypothetical protein
VRSTGGGKLTSLCRRVLNVGVVARPQDTKRCDHINAALYSQLLGLRTALQQKGVALPPSVTTEPPADPVTPVLVPVAEEVVENTDEAAATIEEEP